MRTTYTLQAGTVPRQIMDPLAILYQLIELVRTIGLICQICSLQEVIHVPRALLKLFVILERHGSAFVDGSLYVVGGLLAGKQKKRPSVLCNVERYDPKYMLWSKVADLPKRCYSPGVIRYKLRAYQTLKVLF